MVTAASARIEKKGALRLLKVQELRKQGSLRLVTAVNTRIEKTRSIKIGDCYKYKNLENKEL